MGQLTNTRARGGKKVPLTKNCHTYSTCHSCALPKENPKKYMNHVTHEHFFMENHKILLCQETDIDCVLMHSF